MEKADVAYFKQCCRNVAANRNVGNSFSTRRYQTPRKEVHVRYALRKVEAKKDIRVQASRAVVVQIPALCATTRPGIIPLF